MWAPIHSDDIRLPEVVGVVTGVAMTDAEFIKPFVESAENVFTTMLNMSVKWQRSYVKQGYDAFAEISAVMGTAEGGVEGLLVVSMPPAVVLKAAGGFLGMEVTEIDSDVKECIGEFLNMVAGGAKAKLEGTPYFFKMSIPTVVIGKEMQIHPKPSHCCTVAELSLDGELFVVEVSMKR